MQQQVLCSQSTQPKRRFYPGSLETGFTLIEILIALFIFAIIGVMSSQLMGQSVRAQERLTERSQRLGDVHRAMQIVQRDILQIASRPIRDEYGDPQGALLVSTDGAMEFSRSGWRNPLQLPRAQTQRVGYRVQDEKLIRGYWPVMDRAQDTEPAYQTLLEDVTQVEFYVLDSAGNEHRFWPQPGLPPNIEKLAIIMRLDLPGYGVIERLWEIPNV